MRNNLLSIITIGLLSSTLYATSVRDVVVQTIDANPDILSEKINKEAFKKYIDEEKGDYLPTLDLDAFIEDSTTRLNRDNQPADPSKSDKDGWNASLKFEQVIYDGGLTPSEVEELRHTYNANKFRSNARVEDIIRSSINSYIDLVKSQELMDLSKNNIKTHEDYLITAQEKEEISGEKLESFQVNSKKHFLIDRYLEQEDQKNEATYRYEQFTQDKLDGNICRPVVNEKIIPNTLEKTIEYAISNNYKILEQIEKIKEQRENIIQANAANLPTLRFQWQATWDNDLAQAENGREDAQRTRLILAWNLYEGGKTKDSKDREKLFLQEQQKILDVVVQEVIKEVNSNYNSYFKAKQRIENINKFVQDNENIKDVYLKQLGDGTRTFIDVLNAESELYRSKIDAVEQEIAIYTYYYNILSDMGMLSDSILMSKNQVCDLFDYTEYKNPIKNKSQSNDLSELNDADLLNELGEKQKNSDDEIQQLINEEAPVEKIEKTTLSEGKYTINMATLEKYEDLETFIKESNLNNSENIQAYNMSLGTKVLYGSFSSLKEASEAMSKFEQSVAEKVFVDNLEKHRKLLQKHSSIN